MTFVEELLGSLFLSILIKKSNGNGKLSIGNAFKPLGKR